MATTSINTKTNLVSLESLSFMRSITVEFEATDCKPKCRMYAVFDSVGVNEFITPSTGPDAGIIGGRIFADSDGKVAGTFTVPPMTFNTGTKIFKLTENPNYTAPDINGSTYGSASAEFNSTGIKQVYQKTITYTTVNTVYGTPPQDPLAQSFFTYGVTGGCFITSIDLYFYSKDDSIPVIVEIREMINGYPGPALIDPSARISKSPGDVTVSEDGSIATNFAFKNPFYLAEDKDYCFVILSNCQSYNVFTCTMGEKSLETNKTVFEQPYLGSLFKSQNNQTWTAEQYEDIKFKLYKAEFDTSINANVKMTASAPPTIIPSTFLSTTTGTGVIRAELTFDHNLELGSKVRVDIDSKGIYNGIPAAALTGTFNVTSVLDRRAFEFVVGESALSTGKIEHGGFVVKVFVDNQGTGYNSATPPTITIADPVAGVTATAEAVIENGKITSIDLIHNGSGYTGVPLVTITSSVGSGASATASMDLSASLGTNRAYSIVTPAISNILVGGTEIDATLNYTKGNYEGGNVTSYTPGDALKFNLATRNWLPQNAWLCSLYNEAAMLSNQRSTVLNMLLSSTNKNVSPVINLNSAHAMFSGNLINNQKDEDIESTDGMATIDSITLVTGGAGYTTAPLISFINQYGCTGSGASATAIISGGTVTAISLDNAGSGYTKPPFITFDGVATVNATATASLTAFNTEVLPSSGSARSRYLTKVNTLAKASESARVILEAYSGHKSSFEVYLRTSLKASNLVHTDQTWTLMKCDTERNLSSKDGEYLEYTFYLDNLDHFDTYDIKIVFRSEDPVDVPWIRNYRAILTV